MYTISIHDQDTNPITDPEHVREIALILGNGQFEEIDPEEGVWMVDLDGTREEHLLVRGFLGETVNGLICWSEIF